MANLLENAAYYGGGATEISVGAVQRANGVEWGPRAAWAASRPPSAAVPRPDGITGGPPDTVEIAVDDSGPGIDPIERTKVFERFYRGSASGRRGTGTGSGLGLALVAEHMRLMHGQVWVESSPTGGARFVITLPVLDDETEIPW